MLVGKNEVIADWWFEDKQHSVSPTNRLELSNLLKMCEVVVRILEKYNLLKPSQVIFSGWLDYEANSGRLIRVEEPDAVLDMSLISSQSLLAYYQEKLDELEEKRSFLYPIDIHIVGTGVILDADGHENILPDVTLITGETSNKHIVNVATRSDAWLPYTLLAEPQPEVYKLNAPRLESALQEIQDCLGIVPVTDSHSEYAVIEGFRITNHTDIDGEVIQVLQNYK